MLGAEQAICIMIHTARNLRSGIRQGGFMEIFTVKARSLISESNPHVDVVDRADQACRHHVLQNQAQNRSCYRVPRPRSRSDLRQDARFPWRLTAKRQRITAILDGALHPHHAPGSSTGFLRRKGCSVRTKEVTRDRVIPKKFPFESQRPFSQAPEKMSVGQ